MQLTTLIATAVLMVPAGQQPQNHCQPWHSGAPVIRRFERRPDDEARERNYNAYVRRLDELWSEYRATGSTKRAFEVYKQEATAAKRRYVERDIYLVPVLP
ncbi:MAG: hypothetical protein K2Y37_15425 [Pirellulales bacterium]|nr:hypothetical protein [Pirellulales bacterium]